MRNRVNWCYNAKVRATNSHRNFWQRMRAIHPIGPETLVLVHFLSVSVHLAMFHYYMDLGAKWVELVQLMDKFVPLSRIGFFYNERTRSSPLDPKLKY